MSSWLCASLYLAVLTLKPHPFAAVNAKFTTVFGWHYINFTWSSSEVAKDLNYSAGSDVIAGVKTYEDRVYLALPRVKMNARITLAYVRRTASAEDPLLIPFPNLQMNSGSSCESLQDVLSMEIDRDGVMWVLDGRRVVPGITCPAKIVLLDLNRDGRVLKSFTVPKELCDSSKGCFLNDLVVDGDFAYVSDTTRLDPGILVYDRKKDEAWKIRDASMFGDLEAANFTAQGELFSGVSHINGVALSPNCDSDRTFYYMPQTSFAIYSINNGLLRDKEVSGRNVGKYIRKNGKKRAQSGGMMCDELGYVYYGLLPLDAVAKWDTSRRLEESVVVEENHEVIKWPDSFSFDEQGNLLLVTNSMLYFSRNDIDPKVINFRVLVTHTGTRSYKYCGKL